MAWFGSVFGDGSRSGFGPFGPGTVARTVAGWLRSRTSGPRPFLAVGSGPDTDLQAGQGRDRRLCHLEVDRIQLDADRLVAHRGARGDRGAGAHERVEHDALAEGQC